MAGEEVQGQKKSLVSRSGGATNGIGVAHSCRPAEIRMLGTARGAGGVSVARMPEFLTAKDLESILKIDLKTIYGYVQRGLIPYVKIQSNIRFRRDRILIWIEEQTYEPR